MVCRYTCIKNGTCYKFKSKIYVSKVHITRYIRISLLLGIRWISIPVTVFSLIRLHKGIHTHTHTQTHTYIHTHICNVYVCCYLWSYMLQGIWIWVDQYSYTASYVATYVTYTVINQSSGQYVNIINSLLWLFAYVCQSLWLHSRIVVCVCGYPHTHVPLQASRQLLHQFLL